MPFRARYWIVGASALALAACEAPSNQEDEVVTDESIAPIAESLIAKTHYNAHGHA